MRINNDNNISPTFNFPEPPKNDNDLFNASATSDKPKTEKEWLSWLEQAYKDIIDKIKEYQDPSKKPPIDFTKLQAMYDKAVSQIQESFKNNTNMSPEFLQSFLNELRHEVFENLLLNKRDSFSHFIVTFQYTLENEIEKLTNYQKEEIERYKREIQDKIGSLTSWIERLEREGGSRDVINALKAAKSKLEGQLEELKRSKSPAEFFSKQNIDGLSQDINAAKALIDKLDKTERGFPVDPGKDPFDTEIPRRPDGSVDVKALLEKLGDLLYYIYYGDCANYNAYTALATMLTNLAGLWDKMSDADKKAFNEGMGTPPSSDGKSLGQMLAESVVYGKYFELGKDDEALFEFINWLTSQLEGKDSPFIRDFLEGIKKARDNFGDWKKANEHTSFKDFLRQQSLKNAGIGRSNELNEYFNSVMRAKIKELEALANGDPFLLFYLLLMLLFKNDDKYQTQISGVGKVMEKLSELGGKAGKLGELFQEICKRVETDITSGDSLETFGLIKEFMEGAKAFCEEFKDDPRLADSFSELEDAFKRLFSHDPKEGLSPDFKEKEGDKEVDRKPPFEVDDGKGGKRPPNTLGEYFDAIKNGDKVDQARFADHFKKLCCPGKIDDKNKDNDGKPITPDMGKHFTRLTSDIQAFTKAPLNMNSTMTIKMEEIKSTSEQFGAMITKFAKEPNDLIHRMLERIQK